MSASHLVFTEKIEPDIDGWLVGFNGQAFGQPAVNLSFSRRISGASNCRFQHQEPLAQLAMLPRHIGGSYHHIHCRHDGDNEGGEDGNVMDATFEQIDRRGGSEDYTEA